MTLRLVRKWFSPNSTIGELYVNEVFECFILEDTYREGDIFQVKVPNKTAIPKGTYQVIIDESKRFGRRMPHILNVPNFEGVRIHSGNTDEDTDGCLLTGTSPGEDYVSLSHAAFVLFYRKLETAIISGEKVLLRIEHEPSERKQAA